MKNIKFIIVVVILLLASFVGLYSYLPSRVNAEGEIKMSGFPMVIDQWKGWDVALSQRDYDILETRNLIMRQYTNAAGQALTLYIIYSGDNRKVLHPPEVCYLGGGATITEKGIINVSPKVQANRMVTDLSGGRQLVVYWFKAGDFNTPKYFDQQLKVMMGRLLGKKTSSAMIRISADIKEGDDAAATSMIQAFARDVEPLLVKYVP